MALCVPCAHELFSKPNLRKFSTRKMWCYTAASGGYKALSSTCSQCDTVNFVSSQTWPGDNLHTGGKEGQWLKHNPNLNSSPDALGYMYVVWFRSGRRCSRSYSTEHRAQHYNIAVYDLHMHYIAVPDPIHHHSLNLLLCESHVPEAVYPTVVLLTGPVLVQTQQPRHLPPQGTIGDGHWGKLLLTLLL